jgi:hypothetical protein
MVAAALMLAGCTSLSDFDLTKAAFHAVDMRTADLVLESEPPGANATSSLGPSCRTPCMLAIKPGPDFTVTFTLEGHQPQTVAVRVVRADAAPDWQGHARNDPTLEPNPARVQLIAIPPPEPPKKKPRVAAKPKTAAASTQIQSPAAGFPPASSPR